jgi:hypothetical protein
MGADQVTEEVCFARNDKRNKSNFIAYRGYFTAHTCSHSDNWTDDSRDGPLRHFKGYDRGRAPVFFFCLKVPFGLFPLRRYGYSILSVIISTKL